MSPTVGDRCRDCGCTVTGSRRFDEQCAPCERAQNYTRACLERERAATRRFVDSILGEKSFERELATRS